MVGGGGGWGVYLGMRRASRRHRERRDMAGTGSKEGQVEGDKGWRGRWMGKRRVRMDGEMKGKERWWVGGWGGV